MIRTRCEVLSNRRTGAYHSITLVAPEVADKAKPGQFIEVAVPEGRDFLLRRPFSIHEASRRGGWAGTLEIVLDPERSAWVLEQAGRAGLDFESYVHSLIDAARAAADGPRANPA